MDRTRDEARHADAVDGWLERSIDQRSSEDVLALFSAAFEALWARTLTTLGEVTLTAIAERVLYTATARHPFLAIVNPRPNGDARWKQALRERLAAVPRTELIDGLRFGLVELLTVIGRLTAEILSHDLHTTLHAVTASIESTRTTIDSPAASSARRSKVQP